MSNSDESWENDMVLRGRVVDFVRASVAGTLVTICVEKFILHWNCREEIGVRFGMQLGINVVAMVAVM